MNPNDLTISAATPIPAPTPPSASSIPVLSTPAPIAATPATPVTRAQFAPAGPSIGRIVHYVMSGEAVSQGQHRPAIIVRVEGEIVNLQVFTDGASDGMRYEDGLVRRILIAHDETDKAPDTWHWPEQA